MKRLLERGRQISGLVLLLVGLSIVSMPVCAQENNGNIPDVSMPGISSPGTDTSVPGTTEPTGKATTGASTDAATGLDETTEDYSIPEGSAYIQEIGEDVAYENTDSANAIQNALDAAVKYATVTSAEKKEATIVVNDGTYVGGLNLDHSTDSTLGQILEKMVADKVTEKLTADGTTQENATDEQKKAAQEEAQKEVDTSLQGITIRIIAKDALGENGEILLTSSGKANLEGGVNIEGLNIILAGIYLSTNGTIGISNTEKFEYYGSGKDDVVDISLNNVSDQVVINGGAGNDKIDVTMVQTPNITLDISAETVSGLSEDAQNAYSELEQMVKTGFSLSADQVSDAAGKLQFIMNEMLDTPASWNNDVKTDVQVSGSDGNDELNVKLINSTEFASTYKVDAEGAATGSLLNMKLDFSKIALVVNGDNGNDRLQVSGGMSLDLAAQLFDTIRTHVMEQLNTGNLLEEHTTITMNGGAGDDILNPDTTGGFSSFRDVDWSVSGGTGYDRLHITGKLEETENNLTAVDKESKKEITGKSMAQLSFLNGMINIDNKKNMKLTAEGVESYTDALVNKKSTEKKLTENLETTVINSFDTPIESYADYILTAVSKKDSDDGDAYSYVDVSLADTLTATAAGLSFNNIVVKLAEGTSRLVINNLKAAGFNLILTAEQIQILGQVLGKNILMACTNESVWHIGFDLAKDDLNQANDETLDFTVNDAKTDVTITVESTADITAEETIDMIVVSEQDGFYLDADILSNTDLLEKLNFFTYKDGNASIEIKGKVKANGPIQAVSKVIIISDTGDNVLKLLIPIGVCIAVGDSHVTVSDSAKVESVSSILMHASNYMNLNSQARAGVAPLSLALGVALPDTYVHIGDQAALKSGQDIYLIADAVVRMIAVATGAPVNALATKNASGIFMAVIVADQDTRVTVDGAATLNADGNIELLSNSRLSANSASISVPSEKKPVNAKQAIAFVEKLLGVTANQNQSLGGKLAGSLTGSNSIGNLFTKGTAGAEEEQKEGSNKKSETQVVGALAVNYVDHDNRVLINTTGTVKTLKQLLLHADAATVSYAKADGSLYRNPVLIPGVSAAEPAKNAFGIGISVVYYHHDNTAAIRKGSISADNMTVKAETGRSVSSAISKAGHVPSDIAGVGLGGAITVQVASDNTAATLGKDADYTIGNGNIFVIAEADHTYITVADASGKRATKSISVPVTGFQLPITQENYNKDGTGVGAGIAVFVGGGDVTAQVEDGVVFLTVDGVNADSVMVSADRQTAETVVSYAGAGGGKAVAPVIATVISGYSAESSLGFGTQSVDYYNGTVDVTAQNQVIRKIKADAAAVGVSAGLGGSFVVAVINDSSNASLKRNASAVNIHVLAKGISRFTADSKAGATGANPAQVTDSSVAAGGAASSVISSIKNMVTGSDSQKAEASQGGDAANIVKQNQKGEADQIADRNIGAGKDLSSGVNSKNVNENKVNGLTQNRQTAQTPEGNVQVAAAFVVNVMQHIVAALVGDGLTLTARAIAGTEESGSFAVEAVNDTDAVITANASATKSDIGVGVAAAVNVVTFENKAVLGDSRVTAKKLTISADTLEAAEAETLEEILASLINFLANTSENNILVTVLEEQLKEEGTTLDDLIASKLTEVNTGDDKVTDAAALETAKAEVQSILVSEIVARLTGKKALETASELVQAVVDGLLKEVMENFLKPQNLLSMLLTGENPAIQMIKEKTAFMGEVAMAKIKHAANTYLRMKFGSNDEMEGVGHKISTTAISGAGAANVGVAGAAAVTVINGTTEAVIKEHTTVKETSDIQVSEDVRLYARQVQKVYSTATAAADKQGAADKNKNSSATENGDAASKSVGVGGGAAVTLIHAVVNAGVGSNRNIVAGTMAIIAKLYDDVETIAVAGSDPIARRQKAEQYVPTLGSDPTKETVSNANSTGTKDISVDASAAVGLVDNEVNSYVNEGTKIVTTGSNTIKISDTESVNFYMHSEQHGETLASASAFAVGEMAAVGACAAVNLPASQVITTLAGDVIAAGSAKVDSYTYDADESHAYATIMGASLDRYLDKLRDVFQMLSFGDKQPTNGMNAAMVNKLNGVISTGKQAGMSKVSSFLPASVGAMASQNVTTGATPDTSTATDTTKNNTGTAASGQEIDDSAKEGQSVNIAAAVAVNVTKHQAITRMTGSLFAMAVEILAENHGNFRTLGTGAVVTGKKDYNANNISLGVAVSTNKNEASAVVSGKTVATGAAHTTETTTDRNGDITVDASLSQNMDGVYKGLLGAQALAGSISANGGIVGISGAIAILIGNADTKAEIKDGSVLEGKNIVLNAVDKSKYAVRAGSVTISKGAKAGVGASYAMIYAANNTLLLIGEKQTEEHPVSGVTIQAASLTARAEKSRVDSRDYEFPLSTDVLFTVDASSSTDKGLINLTTTDGDAGKYSIDITISSDDFLKLIDMMNYLASVNYYAEAIAGSILTGENAKGAVAGSMAMVYLDNVTRAQLGDQVTILLTGDMKVTAVENTNTRMISGSLSASSAKVGAGVSITTLVNNEKVEAVTGTDTRIETAGDVTLGAENKCDLLVITVAAAATTKSEGAALGGSVNVIDSSNVVKAVLGENAVLRGNNIKVTAENQSDYTLINASVAGTKGVALGGTVAVILMDNETLSSILSGAKVNAAGQVIVKASTAERLFNILASVSGSTGKPAVAGTIGVIITESQTTASLGDHVIINAGGDIQVLASGNVKQFMILAAMAGSIGKVAVGATVTVDIMNHKVYALTGTGCVLTAEGSVLIMADTTEDIFIITAAGALTTGNAGISGAIAVVNAASDIQAQVGEQNTVKAGDSVGVIAVLNSDFYNIAGGIAASSSVGIGATVSTLVMENNVAAKVMDFSNITALAMVNGADAGIRIPNRQERRKGLVVYSKLSSDLLAASGSGAASGDVAVGGVVDTLVINNSTLSQIGSHVSMNAREHRDQATGKLTSSEKNEDAGEEAHVLIEAEDDTHIYHFAGALAVSGSAGVGATVAVNIFNNCIKAQILDGCHIYAGNIEVLANAKTELPIIIVTFGASGSAAVAGAVSVALFDNEVEASIGKECKLSADGVVSVKAKSDNQIISAAGAVAASGTAAIGAVAPIIKFTGSTIAFVDDSTIITAKGTVILQADSKEDVYGFAAGASASGTASVSGTFELIITEVTTKAYTGSLVEITGDAVTIQATDDYKVIGAAGALAASGTVGVGLSVLVSLSYNTVLAYAGDNNKLTAVRDIQILAKDNRDVSAYAVTAGVSGTVSVCGTVIVTIVGSKLNQDSINNINSSSIKPQTNVDYALQISGNEKAQSYNTKTEVGSYFASANVEGSSSDGAVDGGSFELAGEKDSNSENAEDRYEIKDGQIDDIAGEASKHPVSAKPDTVSAFAGNSSVLTAGGNIAIEAKDNTALDLITGTLAVSGTAGVGIGMTVGILYANVLAYTEEQVTLKAGQNITVQATGCAEAQNNKNTVAKDNVKEQNTGSDTTTSMNAGDSYQIRVITVAGAAGVAGVTASGASLDVYTVTKAYLGRGNMVLQAQNLTVQANSNYGNLIVWNIAASGGVAGVNAAVVRGNYDATVLAAIGADADLNEISQTTRVEIISNTTLNVFGISAAIGAAAVNASVILAFYTASMEAFIGQGTKMSDCGSVIVRTTANVTASATQLLAGVGAAAVGGSVVMVKLTPVILSYVGSTPEGYTQNIASVSTQEADQRGSMHITSLTIETNVQNSKATVNGLSAAVGGVAGNALVALAINRTRAYAGISKTSVHATDDITITSRMNGQSVVNAIAVQAGGIALGAIAAYSELKTQNTAAMDLTDVVVTGKNITVQALMNGTDADETKAQANVITGGLAGVASIKINIALADNAYENHAVITGERGRLEAAGNLVITADGKAVSDTDIKAINAAVVSIGVSLAMTYLKAVSKAGIDGLNTIKAANITITSNLNNCEEYTATATASSGSGGLITIDGAVALSASRASNLAIASGNIETTGDVKITANGNAKAKAEITGITVGLISVGLMFATALAQGSYEAVLRNNSTTGIIANTITVLCNSGSDAYSITRAASGGVNASFVGGRVNAAYSKTGSATAAKITGNGAALQTAGDVTVKAEGSSRSVADAKGTDKADILQADAFKLAASSAFAYLSSSMTACVDSTAAMAVGGAMLVLSYLNNVSNTNEAVKNRNNGAYAVAGSNAKVNVSLIGSETAVAKAVQEAMVKAYVLAGNLRVADTLSIEALSTSLAYANIDTNNFGIVGGIGVIHTEAYTRGQYQAYLTLPESNGSEAEGETPCMAGALNILAKLHANYAVADTRYLDGGVISVSVLNALADNATKVWAYVNGDDGRMHISGDTSIQALSTDNQAKANVDGITGASGIKVGNAYASAELNSDVRAYTTGTNQLSGTGSFTLSAKNQGTASATSQNSNGISLIGVTGAESFVSNQMYTEAAIKNSAVKVEGDVAVTAASQGVITVKNKNHGVTAVGIGAMVVKNSSNSRTEAGIGAGTAVSGRDVMVSAVNAGEQSLDSQTTGGGLISGNSMVEEAKTKGTANVYVQDDAIVTAAQDIKVSAENRLKVTIKNTEQNVSGIKLGAYVITTNTVSNVTAVIGKRAVLTAGRDLSVNARDYIDVSNIIVLFAAGLASGTSSVTQNKAEQSVKLTIDDEAQLCAKRDVDLSSSTDHKMWIEAKTSNYGIASITAVVVSNELTRECLVIIGDSVKIVSENGNITIVAYSVPSQADLAVNQDNDESNDSYAMTALATGGAAGLFTSAGAMAGNTLNSNTNITIGKGGRIETTYGDLIISAQTGSSTKAYVSRKAAAAVSDSLTVANTYVKNPVSVTINGTESEKATIIGKNVTISAINSYQDIHAEAYSYTVAAASYARSRVDVTIYGDQNVTIKGGNIRGYDSVTITAMASTLDHDILSYAEIIGAVGVVFATTLVSGHVNASVATDEHTEIASANIDIEAFAPVLTSVNHVATAEAVANTVLAMVFKVIGYVVKYVMKAVAWFVGLFSKKAKKKILEAVYGWVEEIQSTTAYPQKSDTLTTDARLDLNGKVSIGGAAAGITIDIYEDGSVNAIGVEDKNWLEKVAVDHVKKTITIPYIYNAEEGALHIDAGDGKLYGNLKVYLNNYLPYITLNNYSDYTLILSDITVFNTDVNPVDIAVTASNYSENLTLEYGDETPIITIWAKKASNVILNGEINNVKGELRILLNGGNIYVGEGGVQEKDELLKGDTEFLTKMFEGTNIWVNSLVISGAKDVGQSKDNRLQIGLIRYSGYNAADKISEPAKDAVVDIEILGSIYAGFALLEVMVSQESLSDSILNNLNAIKSLYIKRIKAGGTADIYLPAAKRLYVYKDGTNYEGMEITYPGSYEDTYLVVPSATILNGASYYVVPDTGGHDTIYKISADGLVTLGGELQVDSDIFNTGDTTELKKYDKDNHEISVATTIYTLPDGTNIYVAEDGTVIMISSSTDTGSINLNISDLKFEKQSDGSVKLYLNDSTTESSYITIQDGKPYMHIGKNGVSIAIKPLADGSWELPNGIKVHMMFALINGENNQIATTTYLGEFDGNRRYMIGNLYDNAAKYWVFDIGTDPTTRKSIFANAYLYTVEQIATAIRGDLYVDQTLEEALLAAKINEKLEVLNEAQELDDTTIPALVAQIKQLVTKNIQVIVEAKQERRIVEEAAADGQIRYVAKYQVTLSVFLKDLASDERSTADFKVVFDRGYVPFLADTLEGVNTQTQTITATGTGSVYQEDSSNIPGRVVESGQTTDKGLTAGGTESDHGTLDEYVITSKADAVTAIEGALTTAGLTETGSNETFSYVAGTTEGTGTLADILAVILSQVGGNVKVSISLTRKEIEVDAPVTEGGATEGTEETAPEPAKVQKYEYTVSIMLQMQDNSSQTLERSFQTLKDTEHEYAIVTGEAKSGTLKKKTTETEAETVLKQVLGEANKTLSATTLTDLITAVSSKVSKEVTISATYKKTGLNTQTMQYQYQVTLIAAIDGKQISENSAFTRMALVHNPNQLAETIKTALNNVDINHAASAEEVLNTVNAAIAAEVYANITISSKLEQTEEIERYQASDDNTSANAYRYSYRLTVTLSDRLGQFTSFTIGSDADTMQTLAAKLASAKWLLGTKPYTYVTGQIETGLCENGSTNQTETGIAAGKPYGTGYQLDNLVTDGFEVLVKEEDAATAPSGYIVRYGKFTFAVEKLKTEELQSNETFHIANMSLNSNTQQGKIYDLLRKYIWIVRDNQLTLYTMNQLTKVDGHEVTAADIYENVAGDIYFTNHNKLVINRVVAEYPGTLTTSGQTEYVYVSMTPLNDQVAGEERTLANSVVYISLLTNQYTVTNPFGEPIRVFEDVLKREIYATVEAVGSLIDTTTLVRKEAYQKNEKGELILDGNGKPVTIAYYRIGYVDFDALGKEVYHFYINGGASIFNPFEEAVLAPEMPQESDAENYEEELVKYKEELANYKEYLVRLTWKNLFFAQDSLSVVTYNPESSIVFDTSKGQGIVLNPNGTVYYQADNQDFEIPMAAGTKYFMLTDTERVVIDGQQVIYEYLDADGNVYASHNLTTGEMKWITKRAEESEQYIKFNTNDFKSQPVILSEGFTLQASRVSDNVITILNGSEFFYTKMEKQEDGSYRIDAIIYADTSLNPDRQIMLVQTSKADVENGYAAGIFVEVKKVYEETATTIKALVADNTVKEKEKVVTFNKADLVEGKLWLATSIRDTEYNPVMMAIKTTLGRYYIFPNGYTIGVLSAVEATEDKSNDVFFISQIVIEKFRHTQEVSGSEYQIGSIEAKEIILTMEDEHGILVDKQENEAALKAEKITLVTSTDAQLGTQELPFRIDVTAADGGFSIGDKNGLYTGNAYIRDVAGDLILGDITLSGEAVLNLKSEENIVTSESEKQETVKIQKGGKLELRAGENGNIGTQENGFHVYGEEGGNPVVITNAENVYIKGHTAEASLVDIQITKESFDGIVKVTNTGSILISVTDGAVKELGAVSSRGDVRVTASGEIQADRVNAETGNVVLTAGEGITAAGADTLITGHNITLHSDTGVIGGDTELLLDTTVINGQNGTLHATAQGDIYVTEVNGSLMIAELQSTDGKVTLAAQGNIETAGKDVIVSGSSLTLTAAGSVGSKNNPLITDISGVISMEAGRDLYLQQTEDILTDKLAAGGNLVVTTNGDILIEQGTSNDYSSLLALKKELELKKAEAVAAQEKADVATDYAAGLADKITKTQEQIAEAEAVKESWKKVYDEEAAKLEAARNKLAEHNAALASGEEEGVLTEAELAALKKEIMEHETVMEGYQEKLTQSDALIASLSQVLAQFETDAAITEAGSKAEQEAADLQKKADELQTECNTLAGEVLALEEKVKQQQAVLSAGANMTLNAGGSIGKEDAYLVISAPNGQLEVTGSDIYLGATGNINTGKITADQQNGTLELIALGDIKPVGATNTITANQGTILAEGNIGTSGNKLNTSFNEMTLAGDNISVQNNRDVTIGIIAADNTAAITVIGNLTGAGSGETPDIIAEKLDLYVNNNMGTGSNQLIIQAPVIDRLYAGGELNTQLTAKDVTAGNITAGTGMNITANGNLTMKTQSEISAPQITIDAAGSIASADGGQIKINAKDPQNVILSSKVNEIPKVTVGTYVPGDPSQPQDPQTPVITPSENENGDDQPVGSSITAGLHSTNTAGTIIRSWAEVAAAMKTLDADHLTDADSKMTVPILKLNIQNAGKVIGKEILDSFRGLQKALHLHLGNGVAVTLFGNLISKSCTSINLSCIVKDIKTVDGLERHIKFANAGPLGATVLFHTVLPGAGAGTRACVYVMNKDGSRTLIYKTAASENGSICFAADSTAEYVIVYER